VCGGNRKKNWSTDFYGFFVASKESPRGIFNLPLKPMQLKGPKHENLRISASIFCFTPSMLGWVINAKSKTLLMIFNAS
jgi:hypothetical protein